MKRDVRSLLVVVLTCLAATSFAAGDTTVPQFDAAITAA